MSNVSRLAAHVPVSIAMDLSRSIDPDGDGVGGIEIGRIVNLRVLTGASFASATSAVIRRTIEWLGVDQAEAVLPLCSQIEGFPLNVEDRIVQLAQPDSIAVASDLFVATLTESARSSIRFVRVVQLLAAASSDGAAATMLLLAMQRTGNMAGVDATVLRRHASAYSPSGADTEAAWSQLTQCAVAAANRVHTTLSS